MTKYRIEPKRDFGGRGFLLDRHWVVRGFIVTRNGCNIMPGAVWFRTTAEAMHAIAVYDRAGGNAERFWQLMRQ